MIDESYYALATVTLNQGIALADHHIPSLGITLYMEFKIWKCLGNTNSDNPRI